MAMSLHKFLAEIEGNKLTAFDLLALRHGVPPRRLNEFWSWCFSKEYKKLQPSELMLRWNELHGDYMIILPHHSLNKSIQFMAAIWATK